MDIDGAALFHAGPIISEEDDEYKMVAIGPTTSMRMNPYQSDVLDMGPKIVIGKGGMDDTVREALIRNGAYMLWLLVAVQLYMSMLLRKSKALIGWAWECLKPCGI